MAMSAKACIAGYCCIPAAAALRAGREVRAHAADCGVVWGAV